MSFVLIKYTSAQRLGQMLHLHVQARNVKGRYCIYMYKRATFRACVVSTCTRAQRLERMVYLHVQAHNV